jgi:ABC-type multidrug transport system fused ATPase/permease subunit
MLRGDRQEPMSTLRNLYRILSPRERRQVLLLSPLLCVTALIEVAGIASILPFLTLVGDPDAIGRHEVLRQLYEAGGFADTRSFLIAVGVLMFFFIVGSNALIALTTWAVLRFSWMRNHSIALRLLRSYLVKPYLFFLERHSSDLGKNLVAEVNQVVAGTIVPAMQIVARGIAALAILALLVAVDPLLAALTALVLGGAYGCIFFAIRRRQRRMGQRRLAANQDRFEILSEAFAGVKEIKLMGREREVVRRFRGPSVEFARAVADNAVVGQVPRFILEAIAFGGIVLVVLYLLGTGQDFKTILPILGLYAFAGYRLMPSLQQIFLGLTKMKFNASALEYLVKDLPPSEVALPRDEPGAEPLALTRSIRLRNVTFGFPTAREPLFRGLDLELPAGASIAFVGETGSGKSTLADLILGLLRPDEGSVEIDGRALTDDNLRNWQQNLGYVPQSIFLTNDSITRNIAFGLPDDEIDREAVERAARAACIDSFIRDELPRGYDTVVGERGIRLSGGQRQRIGIARALYQDPQVIVFDEATSSLDGATERALLQAVSELARSKTIIMIAHRLSTVRSCDPIIVLSSGEVVDTGGYDSLSTSSTSFGALLAAATDS